MMNKIWRFVSGIVLLCLLGGIICIGIGFFTGSSPVVIQEHGNLTEYIQRLEMNRAILLDYIAQFRAMFGL